MTDQPLQSTRTARYLLEGVSVLLLLALVVTLGVLHFTRPPALYAGQDASLEQTVQARVLQVKQESSTTDESGMVQISQTLELEILSGERQGQKVETQYHGLGPRLRDVQFRPGEQALVMVSKNPLTGEMTFAVADHVRLWPLGALAAVFALATILVGKWQGLRALGGLLLSLALIAGFIIPQILAGRNPMAVSLLGTALLMAVTLYMIQGWNPAGHSALLGILSSLGITALLALFWASSAHLTGFGSEETLYLQATGVTLDMSGLLLAGIVIGAAGVLDDVVLAQAVTVFELTAVNPTLKFRELYRRSMKIGNTHLASMVNTLILAYVSVALPLLILFNLYPEPWYLTLNREFIAEEIVRTLVGSLGLLLAVPLTTVIATWAALKSDPAKPAYSPQRHRGR